MKGCTIVINQGSTAYPQNIDSLLSLVIQEGEFEVVCADGSFGTVDKKTARIIYKQRPELADEKVIRELEKKTLIDFIRDKLDKDGFDASGHNGLTRFLTGPSR